MVIVFAGKKQSGKNSSANLAAGLYLKQQQLIRDFEIDQNGCLTLTTGAGRTISISEVQILREGLFSGVVKTYSYATALKEFLERTQMTTRGGLWGTDEEKNAPSNCVWDNLPTSIRAQYADLSKCSLHDQESFFVTPRAGHPNGLRIGSMSNRRLMQVFGTDMVRALLSESFINALLTDIQRDEKKGTKLALVTDARFPNEVCCHPNHKKIRLMRSLFSDTHLSETAVEEMKDEEFDLVIDNNGMDLSAKNAILEPVLTGWFREM